MPDISRLPQATECQKKSAEGETIGEWSVAAMPNIYSSLQGRHAKHSGHEWE
jgi:hypothetical protein